MPIPIHLKNYLIDWPQGPDSSRKTFFETTHRLCSPEATYARIKPLQKLAGITRVADVTDLDTLGIPTFTAVRPRVDYYDENISVYNGKGLTPLQAEVSALMEGFERHAGERLGRPALIADLNGISRYGKVVTPEELILPPGVYYRPEDPFEWICGRELFSGEPYFVPAAAVYCPYRPEGNATFIEHFSNTNGLASGNSIAEALSHALAELIERDAATLAELSHLATAIDLNSLRSSLIRQLIEKYRRAGLNLSLKEITSELKIPAFFAASDDPATENPLLLTAGMGAHVNAEIAVMRAITEAAQSRYTMISGAREDLSNEIPRQKQDYHSLRQGMGFWYEPMGPLKDFSEIPLINNLSIMEDIDVMLSALKRHSFDRVIVVNLTVPELSIPVVRVIVPGLEQSAESVRLGPRARRFLQHHGLGRA